MLRVEEPPAYDPEPFPTINAMVWRPVAAGLWRQCEMFDGTYDVQDLADVLEYLEIKDENTRRFEEWRESQEKR
jgi:hypothetical protein